MSYIYNIHPIGILQTMNDLLTALMSRLWTGFFGTESCRTPKIFQNPDFSLKRRDFWVFVGLLQEAAIEEMD